MTLQEKMNAHSSLSNKSDHSTPHNAESLGQRISSSYAVFQPPPTLPEPSRRSPDHYRRSLRSHIVTEASIGLKLFQFVSFDRYCSRSYIDRESTPVDSKLTLYDQIKFPDHRN